LDLLLENSVAGVVDESTSVRFWPISKYSAAQCSQQLGLEGQTRQWRKRSWQAASVPRGCSVARWLSHESAKSCHKKLPDSVKNLVASFQLKSAKSNEILPKYLLFLRWSKSTYKVAYQFFVLQLHYHWSRAENDRLGHHTFWPTIFFHGRFEQRKCSLPPVGTTHSFNNLMQMAACVYTVEQCKAINGLSIPSAPTTF